MNEDPLERHWQSYREFTEQVSVPVALTGRILATVPRRARTRRFVRDARVGAVIVALLGASSALLAALDAARVEATFVVQVGAWAEE